MKNIKIFIFFILALSAVSCSKFLDNIRPRNAFEQDELTEADMEKLLTGLYAKMEYYTFQLWWNNDIAGENFGTGTAATDMPSPCLMNPSNVNVSINVTSYWRNSYSAINQINFLLGMYERSANKDKDEVRKVGAACYYFRAFAYYRLAAHFGNVPIVRRCTDEIIPISPEADVWAFIEEDLLNAKTLCSDNSGKWYVSPAAINALAARVALFQNKMTAAASYADEVIDSGEYSLVKTSMDFSSIFLPESASSEIIFAYINNTRTSSYCNFASTVNDVDGSWDYAPNKNVYKTLFANDDATSRQGDIRKAATFDSKASNRIIKFSNGVNQLATNNDYLHTPVMVSRISEMYLIKAEALGKDAGAATLAAFLKTRYSSSPTEAKIKSLTDLQYQDLILDERRREFYAEGMRWEDIKRTGRLDLLKTIGGGDTYLMYYPIPQPEIDIAGTEKYPQNPGY